MPDRLPGLGSGQQRQAGSGRVVAGHRLKRIHDKSNGGRPGQDTTNTRQKQPYGLLSPQGAGLNESRRS